jgi:hypothetical protein
LKAGISTILQEHGKWYSLNSAGKILLLLLCLKTTLKGVKIPGREIAPETYREVPKSYPILFPLPGFRLT